MIFEKPKDEIKTKENSFMHNKLNIKNSKIILRKNNDKESPNDSIIIYQNDNNIYTTNLNDSNHSKISTKLDKQIHEIINKFKLNPEKSDEKIRSIEITPKGNKISLI